MSAIAATSALGAYQREASRLTAATPRVGGKVITSDAGFSLGPFSVRYQATDYEFDLSGVTAQQQQQGFAEALDAAAAAQQLADRPVLGDRPTNALSLRQALASYNAAATITTPQQSMFSATV